MSFGKWNLGALVIVGLAAGVVQSIAGVLMYVAGVYFSPWSMLVTVLVLLACIVVGVGWYRARYAHSGFGYTDALLAGAAISLCTGVVYAVYNLITINFVYPNFLDEMVRARLAMQAAVGAPSGSFESLRAGASALPIAVGNLVRLTILGVVISVIVALFMRDRNHQPAVAAA